MSEKIREDGAEEADRERHQQQRRRCPEVDSVQP
jgi:hypothetical protein